MYELFKCIVSGCVIAKSLSVQMFPDELVEHQQQYVVAKTAR